MKKLRDKIDPGYLKICVYAAATVLALYVAVVILSYSGGFWKTLWEMFTAILKPIIIGGILCYLFLPIVHKIEGLLSKEDKPWKRPAAVAIFYVLVALILIVIIIALFLLLQGGIKDLSKIDFKQIEEFVLSLTERFSDELKQIEQKITSSKLPFAEAGSLLTGLINGIAGFFSGLLFGVIFSIYFMLDGSNIIAYWRRALKLICGEKVNAAVTQLVNDADKAFSGYIRGQFTDAALVGVISTVALTIGGIPYAAVIGVLIGIGNLIPYVGPVVGYGAVIIICLIMGQYDKLIIGLLILAAIMFIDGNVINPRLLSNNVEVHPLLVIAALLAGGALGGFVGMLIAVPSAALLKMQFDRYLAAREE